MQLTLHNGRSEFPDPDVHQVADTSLLRTNYCVYRKPTIFFIGFNLFIIIITVIRLISIAGPPNNHTDNLIYATASFTTPCTQRRP